MITAVPKSQASAYKGFRMGRGNFDPHDFGVDMARDEFADQMVDDFNSTCRGMLTIDELLLHRREAARFWDDNRHRHEYFDVPDDIILRVILTRRKNPGG